MRESTVGVVPLVRGRGRAVRGIRLAAGQIAYHLRLFARNPREDAVYRTRHLPGGVAWPQL